MPFFRPYIRQSRSEKVQHNSAAYQLDEIRAYYDAHQSELPPWQDWPADKNKRGKTPFRSRPSASRLLSVLQPGDVICVFKLDRMSRRAFGQISLLDELYFERRVKVISITESLDFGTTMGRAQICLRAIMAEMESDNTSVRNKATAAHLRRNGQKGSGLRRYGFRIVEDGYRELADGTRKAIKKEVADPVEQHRLQSLLAHRKKHGSDTKTAEWANAQGWETSSGRAWTRKGISRLRRRLT